MFIHCTAKRATGNNLVVTFQHDLSLESELFQWRVPASSPLLLLAPHEVTVMDSSFSLFFSCSRLFFFPGGWIFSSVILCIPHSVHVVLWHFLHVCLRVQVSFFVVLFCHCNV